MPSDLPALTGPLSGTALEPTALIPPPATDRPAPPVMTPTVLIGSRTVPTPQPEPAAGLRAPRDFAQQLNARRLRHAKRRARRAEERATEPEQPEEGPLDDPTEDDPQQRATRRCLTYRRGRPTPALHRTPDLRLRERRRTLAITAAAATVGWSTPAGHATANLIHTLGTADPNWGVAAGITLVAAGAWLDFYLRGGTTQRGAVRACDVTGWRILSITLARVPLATALLALALYAKGLS